jgi:hypothetical protein
MPLNKSRKVELKLKLNGRDEGTLKVMVEMVAA